MSTVVPGWPVAFRGSLAVAAGLSSWSRLRGSRFHRLFLGGGQRTHPGLTVHRDRIAPGETTRVDDIRCTTPLRTAYDLGRQDDLVEAVVAVDRLANRHRFPPDLLLHFTAHYRGGPGTTRLCATLAHTNPYAGSPMESRLRMIIVQAGLPPPRVQWVVQDVDARTAVWLDLAWPEHRIGVEFEGGGHTDPVEVLRDAGRYTRLVARGWRIYRYTRFDVYGDPGRIITELTHALGRP